MTTGGCLKTFGIAIGASILGFCLLAVIIDVFVGKKDKEKTTLKGDMSLADSLEMNNKAVLGRSVFAIDFQRRIRGQGINAVATCEGMMKENLSIYLHDIKYPTQEYFENSVKKNMGLDGFWGVGFKTVSVATGDAKSVSYINPDSTQK